MQENQNNPNFVIVDLRWPKGFANEHIEGAINIDFRSETFRDELSQLDKNKTYLIYSSCGCGGKVWKAPDLMEELNFRQVYVMWQGLDGWKKEGFPTWVKEAGQ